MIFKLHYFLLTAGGNALSILLGVFIEHYTDASPGELGALLMVTPLLAMLGRPILCSMADRSQAHRKYLLLFLLLRILSFSPFIVIPFLGEQVYARHARACWYLLAALKVCGDLAGGGLNSIADSLAINHAKRVGTSFSVYRVWGTISWMLFGLIIGQVNELWFLPKYVPAFLILIASLVLDALLIWLWPAHYFIMGQSGAASGGGKQLHGPVWPQARAKLARLLSCGSMCARGSWQPQHAPEQAPGEVVSPAELAKQREAAEQRPTAPVAPPSGETQRPTTRGGAGGLSKRAQVRILALLVRRDRRIVLYLAYFVLAGGCHATMSFFFVSLARICHHNGSCDFSQLAGLLQFSMAALETLLFIYIRRIMDSIGRLNSAALAMLLSASKFLFYATLWPRVSPYYALLSEGLTGVVYGINLTLMVEVAHLFAGEVALIVPELRARNIIPSLAGADEADAAGRLQHSLAATMQALVSSASDGIGAGCGSLAFGLILERFRYETLWLTVGLACSGCLVALLAANTLDALLEFKLGLTDTKAHLDKEAPCGGCCSGGAEKRPENSTATEAPKRKL